MTLLRRRYSALEMLALWRIAELSSSFRPDRRTTDEGKLPSLTYSGSHVSSQTDEPASAVQKLLWNRHHLCGSDRVHVDTAPVEQTEPVASNELQSVPNYLSE